MVYSRYGYVPGGFATVRIWFGKGGVATAEMRDPDRQGLVCRNLLKHPGIRAVLSPGPVDTTGNQLPVTVTRIEGPCFCCFCTRGNDYDRQLGSQIESGFDQVIGQEVGLFFIADHDQVTSTQVNSQPS